MQEGSIWGSSRGLATRWDNRSGSHLWGLPGWWHDRTERRGKKHWCPNDPLVLESTFFPCRGIWNLRYVKSEFCYFCLRSTDLPCVLRNYDKFCLTPEDKMTILLDLDSSAGLLWCFSSQRYILWKFSLHEDDIQEVKLCPLPFQLCHYKISYWSSIRVSGQLSRHEKVKGLIGSLSSPMYLCGDLPSSMSTLLLLSVLPDVNPHPTNQAVMSLYRKSDAWGDWKGTQKSKLSPSSHHLMISRLFNDMETGALACPLCKTSGPPIATGKYSSWPWHTGQIALTRPYS